MRLKTTVVGAILSAVGVDAFWRMECPHRLGLGRIDPMTNFGSVSPHAHAIYGSNGFSISSLFDDLAAGDCTSCRVTQDKSAYWHPQLYFKDDTTGEYEEVSPLGGMLAYYFLNGEDIQPFKPGFRMIAGDNRRRDFTAPWDDHKPDPEKSVWRAKGYVDQDIFKQLAIGVNCLNYAKPGEPTLMRHYLPEKAYIDANCPDGIRFELMFPSCWVGGDAVDSPNHKDHVAYPDTVMDGNCPEGFPVRLPGLMFENFYNTGEYKDRSGTFVLSNGDTQGYGYHGDFISGWDEQILGQAVKTCTNQSGRIEDCAVFNIQSQTDASQCDMNVPKLLAHEDVIGPMASLPGGIHMGGFLGDVVDGISDIVGSGQDPALGSGASSDSSAPSTPDHGVVQKPAQETPVEPPSVQPASAAPASAAPAPAAPVPEEPASEVSVHEAAVSEVSVHEAAVSMEPTPEEPTPAAPIVTQAAAPIPEEPASEVSVYEAAVSKEPTPEEPTPAAPVVTQAPEPVVPEGKLDIVSTEYVREGNVLSKIVWVEEVFYVTETEYETCTVTVQPAKMKRAHAHMPRHAHHHY